MQFTAVYVKSTAGYAAFVAELPGANSQGKDLEEARKNLIEAAEMILKENRVTSEEYLIGKNVIRETITI